MSTETPNWVNRNRIGAQREIGHPTIEIWKTLLRGVDQQLKLQRSGRFDKFKDKRGIGFISAFWSDPLFDQVYVEAMQQASLVQDDIDFGKRLRGALFEKMSYCYLSSQNSTEIPVWGEDTVRIVKSLHPFSQERNYGLGQIGVEGKYVPDGLLVNPNDGVDIAGVVECSLGRWENKANKDRQTYGMYRLVKDLPYFAKKPKFYVVSPYDTPSGLIKEFGIELVSVKVPFLQATFMDEFIPFVYSEYRGVSGKTIADVREQWHQSPSGQQAGMGEPSMFRRDLPSAKPSVPVRKIS